MAEIAETRLHHAGYLTDKVHTLSELPSALERQVYDLILMNTTMPDGGSDGMCRAIRSRCRCPVIFLSCAEDGDTIRKMFEAGADDYMVKPVSYDELLIRIGIRIDQSKNYPDRKTPNWSGRLIRLKSLVIDLERHGVQRDGDVLDLSPIEFSLLTYMAERQNTLLLYQDLYRHVWDADCLGDVRTVMVHISNLRKKIDPNRDGIIETVRGAGYIFSDI